MKSRNVTWLSVIGGIVLLAGGLLANEGSAAQAAAKDNHTLRWDTNNPSASRFVTAVPGAVLDLNTGLVWEQAPASLTTIEGGHSWPSAIHYCIQKNVGGTVGWRLPSAAELESVRDPTLVAPYVPASAFTISFSDTTPGLATAWYWSATTAPTGVPDDVHFGFMVNFGDGHLRGWDKVEPGMVWCVRGGMNADAR
jgi:hypothetical protein